MCVCVGVCVFVNYCQKLKLRGSLKVIYTKLHTHHRGAYKALGLPMCVHVRVSVCVRLCVRYHKRQRKPNNEARFCARTAKPANPVICSSSQLQLHDLLCT